jgi:[protein-PII] uridylyltransferase
MTPQIQSLKGDITQVRAAALELHRRQIARSCTEVEDPFRVVEAISDGVDAILRQLFAEFLAGEADDVALLAVGGYGRRELCPQSDIDILFVRTKGRASDRLERMVRALWDGGFKPGHAVRTPEECYSYMLDDLSTANALLESRYLAGSQRLHDRFLARAVHRYSNNRKGSFTRSKLRLLRRSIEDPLRTIYVIEPNLKEGVCGLRDIQRVLWIENMKHRGGTFEAIGARGSFSADELARVKAAYSFYLRVRCELHFTNGVRQDVLERDSVPQIAANLGYAGDAGEQAAVEKLMGDYYRHARNVYRFLRYYLETSARATSLLERVSRSFFSEKPKPYLSLWKGRLYLAGEPAPSTPESVMEVFEVTQEKDARLSETLCEWIRRRMAESDADLSREGPILQAFRRILRGGRNAGRLLKTMHATGVLGRILPEFARLDCLVNFDGHHQFTVDEHTLKTLQELDQIETSPEYPEEEFRRIFFEIRDHLPLRLALLLHDIGKAIPGQHSVSGTETAMLICERLGLDEKTMATVEFLVYRHLELFRVSERRDFSEDGVIQSLARLVGDEERLKMLYLLTYIDIVSVGPGTWTRWKGAQLYELYQKTLIHLRAESHAPPVRESLEVALATAGFDEEERRKVMEHCDKMGTPGYARETLPEKMAFHVKLVEKFGATGETQVAVESFVGYHEVTFCGADRPRLFADLTGVLFSEGLNLLGARIFSRADGVVLDLFQVEVADTVQVGIEERVERIRRKLRRIESGAEGVEDFILRRTRTYRTKRWRKPLFGPSVSFDNESSGASTVIEVSAGDRPGLLYDLAMGLHRLGLDVRTAKVSTLADRAHDVFYVVERDGRKIEGSARRHEVAQALITQAQSPAAALHAGS